MMAEGLEAALDGLGQALPGDSGVTGAAPGRARWRRRFWLSGKGVGLAALEIQAEFGQAFGVDVAGGRARVELGDPGPDPGDIGYGIDRAPVFAPQTEGDPSGQAIQEEGRGAVAGDVEPGPEVLVKGLIGREPALDGQEGQRAEGKRFAERSGQRPALDVNATLRDGRGQTSGLGAVDGGFVAEEGQEGDRLGGGPGEQHQIGVGEAVALLAQTEVTGKGVDPVAKMVVSIGR